jgi:peptidyl-prolyl cis-trans isomerase C
LKIFRPFVRYDGIMMIFSYRPIKTVFLFALLFSFVVGPSGAADSPLKPFQPQKPSKAKNKEDVVVAEVNGRQITLADVEGYLQELPPEVGIQVLKDPERFLESFIQTELLFQEAIRRKVDILPAVQRRIRMVRRQILIQELVTRILAESKRVTDEELQKYFEANRLRFQQEETVRLSHIVLKSEKDASAALAELRQGVPFEEVSRKRSVFESSRETGGEMGVIRRGELDKNIEKVAFSLPIGQVSQPIKTPVGWQIIRVTDRRPAYEAQFGDVKEDVRERVEEIRIQAEYQRLLERLRRENKVSIFPDRLR